MCTRENCLAEAVLTSTHNLCFEQKYGKYQIFLSENFQFLVMKFSIYFNRCVFVMDRDNCCGTPVKAFEVLLKRPGYSR